MFRGGASRSRGDRQPRSRRHRVRASRRVRSAPVETSRNRRQASLDTRRFLDLGVRPAAIVVLKGSSPQQLNDRLDNETPRRVWLWEECTPNYRDSNQAPWSSTAAHLSPGERIGSYPPRRRSDYPVSSSPARSTITSVRNQSSSMVSNCFNRMNNSILLQLARLLNVYVSINSYYNTAYKPVEFPPPKLTLDSPPVTS